VKIEKKIIQLQVLIIKFFELNFKFATFCTQVSLQVIGVAVVISIVNPILLIPSIFIGFMFYFIRKFYLKTARSIKRVEGLGE